ncbi:hypothetical protein HOF92_09685 [bacterium]|jgi:hypothetical protein|nr:hypothetical protein [bacterium]
MPQEFEGLSNHGFLHESGRPDRILLFLLLVGILAFSFYPSRVQVQPLSLELKAEPLSGTAPFRVVIAAEISTNLGNDLSVQWRIGDQIQSQTGRVFTHVLTEPGVIPVLATLKGRQGSEITRSLFIRVHPSASSQKTLKSELDLATKPVKPRTRIPGSGTWDLEHFQIGKRRFLATANHENGLTNKVASRIFELVGDHLELVQEIPCVGATDIEVFSIGFKKLLAIANEGQKFSTVYSWNGAKFEPMQHLKSQAARDLEPFRIGSDHFLAVANHHDGFSPVTNSTLYRWGQDGFQPFQFLPTQGAMAFQYMKSTNGQFLVVANYSDGSTHRVDSMVFSWNGVKFEPYQALRGTGTQMLDTFSSGSENFLVVGNRYGNPNAQGLQIYRSGEEKFSLVDSMEFTNLSRVKTLKHGKQIYIAVGSSNPLNRFSLLLQWRPPGIHTVSRFSGIPLDAIDSFHQEDITYVATASSNTLSFTNTLKSGVYPLSVLLPPQERNQL